MTVITVRDTNQNLLISNSSKTRIDLPNQAATVTEIDLQGSTIVSTSRLGDDLIIKLSNGQKIVLEDYFIDLAGETKNRLLVDSGEGYVELSPDDGAVTDSSTAAALGEIATSSAAGIPMLGAIGGLLGLGAAAGAGGGSSGAELVPSPTVLATTNTIISGTGEPGATVSIDIDGDGEADLTAPVDEGGNWEAEGDFEHGDELGVMQTLENGSESFPETITVDLEAPEAPAINPTNGDVISGTGEPDATVTVSIEGVEEPLTAVVDEDGNWSVDPEEDLPHGTNITVIQTDALGNESEEVEAETDSEPPAAPEINPTNGNLIEGSSEPFATVEISIPDQDPITVEADEEGNWSYAPEVPPADGVVLSATQTDAAGNTSEAAEETVDAVAPDAPTVDPTNGDDITGTGEPFATVSITYEGFEEPLTAEVDEEGNWSITSPTVIPHETVLSVTQSDPAGNTSEATEETVDGEAPEAPVIEPTQGDVITGTGEAGSILSLEIEGFEEPFTALVGEDGMWSVDPYPESDESLPHGTDLTATLTDAAGNTSEETEAETDSEPPLAPVIDPTDGSEITGTGEPNATLTLEIEGLGAFEVEVDEEGAWSFTPPEQLPHETGLIATQTDAAGNTSDESVSTTDSEAPDAPEFNPSSDVHISGEGEPGATVSVTFAGLDEPMTALVDEDGNWEIAPEDIAEGIEDETVLIGTQTDAAGNTSPFSTEVVDAVHPIAPTIDPTDGTEISGTGEPGATVSVAIPGVEEPLTATVDESGNWSVDPEPDLVDGTEVTATQADAAGNTSNPASATVDADAPDAPIINPTDGTEITGTGEPGATVSLTYPGLSEPLTAVVDEEGNWSIDPATDLADGTVVIATQSDAAGNVSDSDTETVDTSAPDAPTIEPTDGTSLIGTGEPGATVSVSYPGLEEPLTVNVDEEGEWTIDPVEIPHGTILFATQSDAAGNVSAPVSETVDNEAPDAPVISPTDGTEISGTAEPGTLLTLSYGDPEETLTTEVDEDGNWAITPEVQLPHGTELTATSEDDAGNVSDPANETTDSEAPDAPVINPSDGTEITGTGEAGATVTLDIVGYDEPVEVEVDEDGTWSFTPDEVLADGTGILAVQTDEAGNGSLSNSEVVDAVAPGAPTIEPTNGSSLIGTGEPLATIAVTYEGLPEPLTAEVDEDGNWAIEGLEIPDGTVVFATQLDDAGNESGPVAETVDNEAPDAPVISPTDGTEISGTGEPGATVSVAIPGVEEPLTATVDESGNWSVDPEPDLVDGTEVTATQADAAGNTSNPASATVDADAPDAPIINPTDGTEITGTGEPGATVSLTYPGLSEPLTAVVDEEGNWSIDPATDLADGTVVIATQSDAAGNSSDPATAVIDAAAPVVAIDLAGPDAVSGTSEAGAAIALTIGGTAYATTANATGAWSVAPADPDTFDNGEVVLAIATDATGNSSDPATAVIDAAAPVVAIDLAGPDAVSGTSEAGAAIALTIGGTAYTTTANATGAWSVAPTDPDTFDDGEIVSAIATDATGNSSDPATAVIDVGGVDTDLDGILDVYDLDDDNDGILDIVEQTVELQAISETIQVVYAQNFEGAGSEHSFVPGDGSTNDPFIMLNGNENDAGLHMHEGDIFEFSFGQTVRAGTSITLIEGENSGDDGEIAIYVTNGTTDQFGDANNEVDGGVGYANTIANGTLVYQGPSDADLTFEIPIDATHLQLIGIESHGGWAEMRFTTTSQVFDTLDFRWRWRGQSSGHRQRQRRHHRQCRGADHGRLYCPLWARRCNGRRQQ